MKTTILKASIELAETISSDLTSRTIRQGKPIFTRSELPKLKGFEITGRRKDENGTIINDVVFRFTNVPAPKIEYNENLITLD